MKTALRRVLRIGAIALGALLLLAAAAVLLFLFDKPLVRNIVRSQLAKRSGMTVRLGKIDYSLFPFRLKVDNLELGQETAFQKMSLTLARLEARGDFGKLIRGRKPAFESVEADGAVLRLEQKAVSEEPLDMEGVLAQASDALTWLKRFTVTNARLSILLASSETKLDNLDLSLTAGEAAGEAAFSIGRCDVGIKGKDGAFAFSTRFISTGSLRLAPPYGLDTALRFGSPRFAAAGVDESFDELTFEAAARVDTAGKTFAVSRLRAGVAGLVELDGTADGGFGHDAFLNADARARFDDLEALAARLKPHLSADLRAARLRGRAELVGRYGLHRSSHEIRDSVEASLVLSDVLLDHAVSGIPLHAALNGRLKASGPTSDPKFGADFVASFGKILLGRLGLEGARLHVAGSATLRDAEATRLEAGLMNPSLALAGGRSLSFEKAGLAGRVSLDFGRKTVSLDALEVRFPGLSPLLVSGRAGFGPSAGAAAARLESRGLDIPALRTLAAPFLPQALAAWDIGGTADLALEARRPPSSKEGWALSALLSLAQFRFNDPSFTIAGESLNPRLEMTGGYTASRGLSFTGGLDLDQGESLWKAVYVSWSKHPLKVSVSGRSEPAAPGLRGLAARFALPTIGEINVRGTLATTPATAFDLHADARLSLGPLYSLYTQAGVSQESRTVLEGRLGADLALARTSGALSVRGKLTLAETNVEFPGSKTLLVGVSAELPVHYETAAAASGEAGGESLSAPLPAEGFFRVGEFQSPFLTLKPVAVSLRVGTNAFAIEPLALDLFGGRLELGRTAFRLDPRDGSLRGVGSLALRDIDIARFPIRSPQFKLTGKIRAEFPRLDISAREIAVSGRGEADVFGGKVVLRDLAVARPFAANRSIALNIGLIDLDLKKVTDEVPFGEVTGVVRGEIRGLVLSYGQPERFEFRLESVPRRGVPQTFSLKAVDNLTVLSSGQRASRGGGGFWMSLVRGFRYQKLGIVSTLRNDTFTLNGTIHEGGVEYLVKKPALFGISVINREPDKVISFKEMTSRLKRVGQSEK